MIFTTTQTTYPNNYYARNNTTSAQGMITPKIAVY